MLGPLNDLLADSSVAMPPEHRAGLHEAQRAGRRLQRLVDALLDVARAESGQLGIAVEPTDLAELTADCASMFRSAVESAGPHFVVDTPPLPQPVLIDREQWGHIVSNLLANAVKFTRSGTIAVTLQASGERIELVVTDTGIGIPSEELEHIFARFHQVSSTELGGAGIGLSLVRDLVRAHDGEITVQSSVGTGSTFTVSIPLRQADAEARPLAPSSVSVAAATAPASIEHPPAEGTQGSVLVVEDNPDLCSYIARVLHGDGWEVHAVADTEAAFDQRAATAPGRRAVRHHAARTQWSRPVAHHQGGRRSASPAGHPAHRSRRGRVLHRGVQLRRRRLHRQTLRPQ
jgi:anti-sigma regulatory factor (Ser/Thr protein kinase)